MKLLSIAAVALACVPPAELLYCDTLPNLPSPAYVVPVPGVRASAMSPDEKDLAVFVVNKAGPKLQVWDFVRGSLVQTRSLSAPELHPHSPGPAIYVRYTSDGELLAVYAGDDRLHVLRARDLNEVRTIKFESQTYVTALDLSPAGHRAAVRLAGDVRIYDLDSGEDVRSWTVHQNSEFRVTELLRVGPQLYGPGLAWRGDGQALAISVADNGRCLRGGGTIYIFDVTSEQVAHTFRVPLLSTYIAFGTGNDLYVASNACGGFFTHWALDLPIFDSDSGREIGKIPAGQVGIRDYIVISANKQILLGFADREKTTFEGFEDTLSTTDEQWQVWDLTERKLVLTLPARANMSTREYPSLSSSGRFVYANQGEEVRIFSVPIPKK